MLNYNVRNRIRESWEKELIEIVYLKKPVLILTAVYVIGFYSIFRANFNYLDDLGRKHSGYHGWLDWSRWFTQIFSNFLHADLYLSDISPLPQMLACILLAMGSAILLRVFGREKKIGLVSIAAASLTGLTPYFLGIISYKYDSPYMAFSFFVSVFPFLFYRKKKAIYVTVSFVCLLLMCTSYQASSGIYPLVTIFLALYDLNEGEKWKDSIGFIISSLISYAAALFGFRFLLMRPNEAAVFSLGELLHGRFFQKYLLFYSNVYFDFKASWKILIFLLVLLFFTSFVLHSKMNKILALILSIAGVFAGSFVCFGVNLIMDIPKFDARAMYGLGALLAVMAVCVSFYEKKILFDVVCAALCWCFFTFSLSYANALAVQQDYLNYRVQLAAGDLNSLENMNTEDEKTLQIRGDIGLSPVIVNMSEGFDMLERLVPSGFSEGYWGEYYFVNYFNIPNIEQTGETIDINQLPVLKDTMYHTIYGDGQSVVIELK